MAIIDLGTRSLGIGSSPSAYSPFVVQGLRIWLMYAEMTVETPSNLYSRIRVRGQFLSNEMQNAYMQSEFNITPLVGTSYFLIEIPEAVPKNTDLILSAERLPITFGTSDTAGEVTMRLFFDDAQIGRR